MVNSLIPKSICKDVENGKISRSLASDLLISLIEGSDDHIMRADSIKAFGVVGIKDEKAFKILENFLLSDESQMVRGAALKVIGDFYLNMGIDSINWIIHHDKSPLVLKILIDMLTPLPKSCKESISKIIDKISSQLNLTPQEVQFIIDLEVLFTSDQKKSVLNIDIYKKYTKLRTLTADRKWLVINGNAITSLSYNYFNWKYLRNNPKRIKSISKLMYPDIYLNRLNNLSQIENTAIIPDSVSKLEHLKILDLSNNNLNELPNSLISLKQLCSLDLSFNNFISIPTDIFLLKNLKTLDLSYNNIQTIPNEIKNLKSLRTLLLYENPIRSIPESLSRFLNSLESFKYL